ncbi:MAG: hypothetical protein ABGY95_03180 [Rubritalea sp.]
MKVAKTAKPYPASSPLRDGGYILLTNLDESDSSTDLFEVYRLRWNVS